MQHVTGSDDDGVADDVGDNDNDDDDVGEDGDLGSTITVKLNNSGASSRWTWCDIGHVALAVSTHHTNLSKFSSWLQFFKANI